MAEKDTIQWLSHAMFKITTAKGKIIYIDPWISDNPLCPISLDDVTEADVVLVTHDHFDHVANAVDIANRTGATVVAQPETVARLKEEGLKDDQIVGNGSGMNIGGSVEIEEIRMTMTQAFHSSETGAPAGYIIKTERDLVIYHAGDTGIFKDMETLGEIYDIDIALIPIGSHFVMDPTQSAHSLRLIKPKIAIPMHYKTFPLLVQDADEFVKKAKEVAPEVEIVVLEPGEECKR